MLKTKKNLFKIVAIFTIILMTVFGFTGCKKNNKNESDEKAYLQPITDYLEGIKSKDLSRVAKAYPDFMKISEKITEDDINELYSQYESMYGANIKIDYSFGDAVSLTEDEINDVESNIAAVTEENQNIDVTAAYYVPVTITVTGDGITNSSEENNNTDGTGSENDTNNTEQQDVIVIQYNGNWYVI